MRNFIKSMIIYVAVPLAFIVAILILGFTCMAQATEVAPVLQQPEFSTTVDSVTEDVSYSVTYDATTNTNLLNIEAQAFGTCIYDDPETSYIDGIRINDQTVDSLIIPIDLSVPNKITVRTVYRDDITGTIAQIADGTYDYTELLKNPLALAAGAYYVISILSVICGMIGVARSRKKKVKSNDEIAGTVDARAKAAFDSLSANIMAEVKSAVEPVFKTISETQTAIVESIVLMNSKDKSSHLQALDCLKRVAGTDVQGILDNVHSELEKTIENAKLHKEEAVNTLAKIAETVQESTETLPIF